MNIVMHLISILTILSNGFAKIFIYYNNLNAFKKFYHFCVCEENQGGWIQFHFTKIQNNFKFALCKVFQSIHHLSFKPARLLMQCSLFSDQSTKSLLAPGIDQLYSGLQAALYTNSTKLFSLAKNPAQNLHQAPRFLL